MPLLSEVLLDPGTATERAQLSWRRTAGKVSLVCVALVGSVTVFDLGADFGRTTPHTHTAYGTELTARNPNISSSCYTFTGATCEREECLSQRQAVCDKATHQCMCVGSCTGADGICYKNRSDHSARNYKQIGNGSFTLWNKKFWTQKMYMPYSDPLRAIKTTISPSFNNFGKDKWILHEMPGMFRDRRSYILTTEAFPDWVATIRSTALTAFSFFGVYEVSLDKLWAPQDIAVTVCGQGDAIMIGSVSEVKTAWFYVHHASWQVYGWLWSNNPGAGGLWVPDPPFPSGSVPQCQP